MIELISAEEVRKKSDAKWESVITKINSCIIEAAVKGKYEVSIPDEILGFGGGDFFFVPYIASILKKAGYKVEFGWHSDTHVMW